MHVLLFCYEEVHVVLEVLIYGYVVLELSKYSNKLHFLAYYGNYVIST